MDDEKILSDSKVAFMTFHVRSLEHQRVSDSMDSLLCEAAFKYLNDCDKEFLDVSSQQRYERNVYTGIKHNHLE